MLEYARRLLAVAATMVLLAGCGTGVQYPAAPTHDLSAGGEQKVKIFANGDWQDTGVKVARGDQYQITAQGTWSSGAFCGVTDATGAGVDPMCDGDPWQVGTQHASSLIGRIGPTGHPFPVGKSLALNAQDSGELYLRDYDTIEYDNDGFMNVTITATSARLSTLYPYVPARTRAASWMGITDRDAALEPSAENGGASGGALVEFVMPAGPATAAGLREGDTVLSIGDRAISGAADTSRAIVEQKPGASLPVAILREGQRLTLTVTLAEPPADLAERYREAVQAAIRDAQSATMTAQNTGNAAAAFAQSVRAARLLIAFHAAIPDADMKYDQMLAVMTEALRRLPTRPAIPPGAAQHNRRAIALTHSAASDADNDRAAQELESATYDAPWIPDLYLNRGLVLQKAGAPEAAKAAFQRYLLLNPAAPDAGSVRQKIADVDILIEERRPWIPFLQQYRSVNGNYITLTLRDRRLVAFLYSNTPNDVLFYGTISNGRFQGKYISHSTDESENRCFGPHYERDVEGRIDPSGQQFATQLMGREFQTQSCLIVKEQWQSSLVFALRRPQS